MPPRLLLRAAAPRHAEDVWLIRRAEARATRPRSTASCATPGWSGCVTLAITVPALALALSVGSDFMPQLDEGAFLLQTVMPPEASLDEVDRLNHRVEDVLRRFAEVEDVVRRTGRAERTEDPMPHVVSDVLVVLKPDERERPRRARGRRCARRSSDVPGVTILFTTPLGMRIDEGLGGTPADLSGADLRSRPRTSWPGSAPRRSG